MTAIVGVLNKHGVAIAADSAVTMGNTHKVVNSANKIFTLSKYHPVAVMTYNNAAFMGVPWDIIIKEYRRQLKDKNFHSLKDYVDDFISFLSRFYLVFISFLSFRNFFCDETTQSDYMMLVLDSFYKLCRNEIERDTRVAINDQAEEQINEKLNKCLEDNKAAKKCIEFESFRFKDFAKYAKKRIENYAKDNGVSDSGLLMESFFYYLSAEFSQPFCTTGLVFVGYGESEIYPSLYPINISMVVDNHLKYCVDKQNIAIISEHGTAAAIIPFAQVDVTQTIIRGINPSFQDIIYNVFNKCINSFLKSITDILEKESSTKVMSDAVKSLDVNSIVKEMILKINGEIQETYTNPLLNTVISLDKEDMANMAESFISLTSLVRRMQPGEETVGGPVDVAFISNVMSI